MVGLLLIKIPAVLPIEAAVDRLRPIPMETSKELQAGRNVFAIGNLLGLTTGVISALGGAIDSVTRRPMQRVIQTQRGAVEQRTA